jgi:hemolysin activation/secretion protein
MSKIKLFTLALLALSQSAFAQLPAPAGGQIQQIPPAPVPQRAVPDIKLEPGSAPVAPALDAERILVRSLHVTGNTLYSEAELVAITGFSPGRELALSELRGMASRIEDHYRRNGYFVAQAYLPAQDVKDGAVTIAVIEGRYGSITLRNQTNLSDSLANGLLRGLNSGDPIASAPLENRLLLLSDLPGVNVRSNLVPGASPGVFDLIVEVTPGRRVTGSVEADNAGDRYTGEYRLGATVNFNNLAGLGDVLSLRVLTAGNGLNYGRASYQIQLGKATVGVAYTALEYELEREFAPLRAHGTAQIFSLFGSYPLVRSRNTSHYAVGALDFKTFRDEVDATSTVIDKDILVGTVGAHGYHRDGLGGGGLSTYSLAGSFGNLDIRTPAALAVDGATAQSNGHYSKLGFTATRLQTVTGPLSLYGAISGQLASKNLDISEKMVLGGPYGVRAYPVGEAYADEGYLATLEARLLLPRFSNQMPGQMHLIGFVDTGTVRINEDPWTTGDNSRTLSGYGIGLNWIDYNNFFVNLAYARKLGSEDAISAPDKSGRFWVRLVKYF